jgi:anthranilate phosphoribosyltransferase
MDGEATQSQIGALLVALRMKGETIEEVAGFADGMRSRCIAVQTDRRPLVDTCGTGGGTFRAFNISTAAAFVAAYAGVAVAKHGNRAVSSVCGSADVLEALGIAIALPPERCAECIEEIGIAFLFAPAHHPAMMQVSAPRRELGIRTVFNLLGPLTNPAGATRQLMGVYDPRLCGLAAGALALLGSEHACVVNADLGIDEISTVGATRVAELRAGVVSEYRLDRKMLGLQGAEPDPAWFAPAATPVENARILRDVLAGSRDDHETMARRDMVAVNAAGALRVGGLADSWPEAVELAQRILASGGALQIVDRLAARHPASRCES